WNAGAKEAPNLGHKPRQKEGYFPAPPVDSMQDLRSEMVLTMEAVGIPVEAHHHEVATAGQAEIDMRFTTAGCCARAASGHAAAKPSRAMKARRRITRSPRRRGRATLAATRSRAPWRSSNL